MIQGQFGLVDEFEVAQEFEDNYRIEFNFAPPLAAKRDADTGNLKKASFGKGTFTPLKLPSKARRLRGAALDIYGYSAERQQERQLLTDYKETIHNVLTHLADRGHETAVEIASVSDMIHDYGPVKEQNIKKAKRGS